MAVFLTLTCFFEEDNFTAAYVFSLGMQAESFAACVLSNRMSYLAWPEDH